MSDAEAPAGEPAELGPPLATQLDRYIEAHHGEFAALGDELIRAFPPDPRHDRISTQVRNLQQVVTSATRFADIEDFVKNQMGKDRSKDKPWLAVGDAILKQLGTLRAVQVQRPGGGEDAFAPITDQLQFRLRLARGWVRAVVSQYLYKFALQQIGRAP